MPEPIALVLELARASEAGDPYAFQLTQTDYLLRSEGGGFTNVELSWDDALLRDLEAVRLPRRNPVVMQRLGETLRRFLSPAGWQRHEAAILAAVSAQRQVILTLRLAAAELYALPWELLTLKSTGQHVGELSGVLLQYEWPETTTMAEQPAVTAAKGRILLSWSAAGGAVPSAEHLAAIQNACAQSKHPFDAERDVLPYASLARIAETLDTAIRTNAPVTILHLLCHGSAAGDSFGLTLDSDDPGESVVVDAGRLRQVLAPYASTVRLVILSACDSGNVGALGNQLGAVAQALHRAGIAKVVASRYPLLVSSSIVLAEIFYRELFPHSIEAALLAARRGLARNAACFDWAGVQLYARAADRAFVLPRSLIGRSASRSQPAEIPRSPAPRSQFLRQVLLVVIAAVVLIGVQLGTRRLMRRKRPPPVVATPVVATPVVATPVMAPIAPPPATPPPPNKVAAPVTPPPPLAVPKVQNRRPAQSIAGTWEWFNDIVITLEPDFSAADSNGQHGKWRVLDSGRRLYAIEWQAGWLDKLELSRDGNKLDGTNQVGIRVFGHRRAAPAKPGTH